MLTQLLKAVLNFFCGSPQKASDTQPPHQQAGQHQQTQPSKPHQPQVQQPQWQGSSAPHRPPKKNQDANQINQSNEHYVSLRAQANEHGDQMAKCFRESHDAYERRDGALAKELSNKGKEHQRKMEQINKQASDYIFVENNKDSEPGEIDLHGLYVKEAIARADEAIINAKAEGRSQLNLIVGKGLHSQGGVAKIKPAIENLMQKHNLKAQIDPHNAGVLIVMIEASSGQRGIGADEISRRLGRDDEGCTIM